MSAAIKDDLPLSVVDLRPRIESTVVAVTPALAREWLSRNDHNRHIRPRVVQQYVRDMRSGRWLMTAEPIKFSVDNTLLDGQHRLHAVIDANVTVDMLVVTGLANTAQDVMDTGSRRTAADMLTLAGHPNSSLLAASVKWVILYEENRLYTDRANRSVTNADILHYVAEHPGVEDAISTSTTVRRHIDLQPAILAACYWIVVQVDRDDAGEFLARLADGIDLPKGSPILALRNRLRQIRKLKTRVEPEALMALFLRSWNAWRAGRSLTALPTHKSGAQIRAPKAV